MRLLLLMRRFRPGKVLWAGRLAQVGGGHAELHGARGAASWTVGASLTRSYEEPYGPEVDIWSIGVICYILLCGYFPFTGDESFSEDSMFSRIMTATFSFPDPEWTHISQEAKVCCD